MVPLTIHDLSVQPWTTQVIFAAVRLGIFTILSRGGMTAEEAAARCGAVPAILAALLDACAAMRLLELRDGIYSLSDFSRAHLVEGEPGYAGDLVRLQHDEAPHWHRLHDIVTGEDVHASEETSGSDAHRTFIRAMNDLGMLGEADALAGAVDLSGRREMVDAGGGSGLYSVTLLRAYPGLRATILDRKETLAVTEEMIAGTAEEERITLREADITKDAFGTDVDVVLLSDVVYDERDVVRVLKSARDCLRKDGLLVVRGYYSDPGNPERLFGALFVLNQLVFDSSRSVLTAESLREHVESIGFHVLHAGPLTERSTVLMART